MRRERVVSNSVIGENDIGLNETGGAHIVTRLSNTILDNGVDGSFTGSFAAL